MPAAPFAQNIFAPLNLPFAIVPSFHFVAWNVLLFIVDLTISSTELHSVFNRMLASI